MKSLNAFKLLSMLAVVAFSSMTFASEHQAELATKLGDAFDAVILQGKLSEKNLSELDKGTQIEVELDGKMQSVRVVAKKDGGLHLTSFKNNFGEHKNPERHLNCAAGVFSSKYNYKNLFGSNVEYTLSFSSDAITRLCGSTLELSEEFVVVDEDDGHRDNAPVLPRNNAPVPAPKASQEEQLKQLLQVRGEGSQNDSQQGFRQDDRELLKANFTVSVETNKQAAAVLQELAEQRANQEAHAAATEAMNVVLNRQVKEGKERHAQLLQQLESAERNADERCSSLQKKLTEEFEVTRVQMTEEFETTRKELKDAIANGPISHRIKNAAMVGLSAGWATERYSLPSTVPCCPCSAPVTNASVGAATCVVVQLSMDLVSKLSWCCNSEVRKVVCKTACMSAKSCCGCGKKKSE